MDNLDIKMQRVIMILGVLLFPKALSALKCYVCIDAGTTGSCTEPQRDCPASQQCAAAAVRTYVDGTTIDVKVKACVPSAGCDVSGSMEIGISRVLSSVKCCSTDLCNVQYPTLPGSSSSPNGKRCFTCNMRDKNCSDILSCHGDEDHCFSSRVEHGDNKMITKGCVSKSLCVAQAQVDTPTIPGMTAHVSCCEGDLCNSATSTAVGLLLLLAAPVVSVALFN